MDHNLQSSIKKLSLVELSVVIILSYLFLFFINSAIMHISYNWLYVILILYIIFKLRNSTVEFRNDLANLFSSISFSEILLIVFANILFSYGMLYLADFLITSPQLKFLLDFNFVFKSSILILGGYLTKLIVAPILEEILFRGVILDKLQMIVPMSFAILISSILFGSLHGFGSIVSAIVFAFCMSILYLKTSNILVVIFAHFLNNLIAETIFALDYNKLIFTNDALVLIISISAVISLIYLIFFFHTQLNIIKYKTLIE